MTLYDIPFLNNKKTFLASYGLILAGVGDFLGAVTAVVVLTAGLLAGDVGVMDYFNQAPELLQGASTFLFGLLGVGIGHKLVKAS